MAGLLVRLVRGSMVSSQMWQRSNEVKVFELGNAPTRHANASTLVLVMLLAALRSLEPGFAPPLMAMLIREANPLLPSMRLSRGWKEYIAYLLMTSICE